MAGHPEHPSDAPSSGADPARGDADDDLEKLRRLLSGPEQDRLRHLQEQVDACEVTAGAVSQVLPDAITARAAQDERLARALAPSVVAALTESVHRNPKPVAQAIYPTLGPAIRRSIAEALAGFVETLNRAIDHSLSVRGLRWRVESWRTGVPFAQIVIRHSLLYQVEQVFLIHAETGLLLAHAAAPGVHGADADLVSGMLTAIRDFVADSFDGEGGLRRFAVGEHAVLVEAGPQMVVAAVVRGQPPASLFERLQDILETLHTSYHQPLERFDGERAPFAGAVPTLETCLDTVLSAESAAPRRGARLAIWLLVGAAVVLLASFPYRSLARWNRATTRLRAEPGLVLVEANHGWWRSTMAGLRDPLAAAPEDLLADAGLDLSRIDAQWRPYLSLDPALALRRSRQRLGPPETVTLSLEEGRLSARGTATPAWLGQAAASLFPGVETIDLAGVEPTPSTALRESVGALERQRVPFSVGSAAVDREPARQALEAAAEAYGRMGVLAAAEGWDVEVTLVGRTDRSGSDEFNAVLRRERSSAVRAALGSLGVPAETLRSSGAGAVRPLEADDPDRRSAMNRTISFVVALTPRRSTAP